MELPVLALPSYEGSFVLDADASDSAIGAVLWQKQGDEERVIAYASRRLSQQEKNYCVTRRELLAVVNFMKYFRHYLLGRQFVVRTDHAALRWLRKIPEPIGQQARWLEMMEEFQFEIIHRPGRQHGNADAMSRKPCDKPRCCPRQLADEEQIPQAERDSGTGVWCYHVSEMNDDTGDGQALEADGGEPASAQADAVDVTQPWSPEYVT